MTGVGRRRGADGTFEQPRGKGIKETNIDRKKRADLSVAPA